jgi:hypothetical protein
MLLVEQEREPSLLSVVPASAAISSKRSFMKEFMTTIASFLEIPDTGVGVDLLEYRYLRYPGT